MFSFLTSNVVASIRREKIRYSHFRKYAHPLDVKRCIITEKVFPVFSERFFLDLFWLGHIHLGVNGCHRKDCISNVKK